MLLWTFRRHPATREAATRQMKKIGGFLCFHPVAETYYITFTFIHSAKHNRCLTLPTYPPSLSIKWWRKEKKSRIFPSPKLTWIWFRSIRLGKGDGRGRDMVRRSTSYPAVLNRHPTISRFPEPAEFIALIPNFRYFHSPITPSYSYRLSLLFISRVLAGLLKTP